MLNGKKSSLAISRIENHHQVTFKNNIIYRKSGPFVSNWGALTQGDSRTEWENNIFWSADGVVEFNAPLKGIITDPKFTDPAHGDWTLKPDSPALKRGFKPWDFGEAGRRNYRRKLK